MIEHVKLKENGAVELKYPLPMPVKPGSMTRPAGSTIKKGDLILKQGSRIRPTDLAALAMGDYALVPVVKKPVVAMIPTGSELIAPGRGPKRGENIDTNSFMVTAQLKELGADVITFPIIRDEREELAAVLEKALMQADLVVINGGSSKGSEDFNVHLLEEKGQVICHEVAAVPGRPVTLALVGHKPVVNVPGPTLAAYFVTDWCLRAMISRWLGVSGQRRRITGVLAEPLEKGGPVQILHRMNVVYEADGTALIYPIPMRGKNAAAADDLQCPVCDRAFEEHQRKGSFWR